MLIYLVTLCLISGGLGKPAEVLLDYQDSIGQYSFGYSAGDSARSEVRSVDGSVRGAFSYVDGAGIIQTAKYTADSANGFRIEATNLPEAPTPTAEVITATQDHLQALKVAAEIDTKTEEKMLDDVKVKSIDDDKSTIDVIKIESDERKKVDVNEKNDILVKKTEESIESVKQNEKSPEKAEEQISFVRTSLMTPAHNLNLQNHIELRVSDSSVSSQPTSQVPMEISTKAVESSEAKSVVESSGIKSIQPIHHHHHQTYAAPINNILLSSSYGLPIYSNQPQFIYYY